MAGPRHLQPQAHVALVLRSGAAFLHADSQVLSYRRRRHALQKGMFSRVLLPAGGRAAVGEDYWRARRDAQVHRPMLTQHASALLTRNGTQNRAQVVLVLELRAQHHQRGGGCPRHAGAPEGGEASPLILSSRSSRRTFSPCSSLPAAAAGLLLEPCRALDAPVAAAGRPLKPGRAPDARPTHPRLGSAAGTPPLGPPPSTGC